MVLPTSRDKLRNAIIIALYPVVWVLAHKAAVAMDIGPGVSTWYPPAGLTFAFLLRYPRFWPLAYVGIGYVVLFGPYAVTTLGAWLSWLIPPTGYVVGVALLRRWLGGPLDLSRQAHIHRFIVASLATPAIVAVVNVLNFCADGAIPWSEYGPLAARFFIGDALGIVTLAPTLLLLDRLWRAHFRQRDGRVLFLGLMATALILYLEVAELLLEPNHAVLAGAPYFMLSIGYLSLIIAGAVEDREGTLRKLRKQETTLEKAFCHFTTHETASKLAHEIRQPLASASTYARALHTMAQRVREIIAANQAQFDQAAGRREILPLAAVMGDVVPLLRQICDDGGVSAQFELDGCAAKVLGDRATLQQLAVNLVRDAYEAMP